MRWHGQVDGGKARSDTSCDFVEQEQDYPTIAEAEESKAAHSILTLSNMCNWSVPLYLCAAFIDAELIVQMIDESEVLD